nr:GNAT family N-acetyltransferase [uncultured Sphingomonas sp.]
MTHQYRTAISGDGVSVSTLFQSAFIDTFGYLYEQRNVDLFLANKGPDAFEAQIADPDFAFRLAEEDGRLIGYIKMGPNELPGDAPAGTWELHQLYLTPDAKGRGIAQELMDWGFEEARRRGFQYLQLSVYVDNLRAKRLYEKIGFEEVGQFHFMVGDHADDERLMRIKL